MPEHTRRGRGGVQLLLNDVLLELDLPKVAVPPELNIPEDTLLSVLEEEDAHSFYFLAWSEKLGATRPPTSSLFPFLPFSIPVYQQHIRGNEGLKEREEKREGKNGRWYGMEAAGGIAPPPVALRPLRRSSCTSCSVTPLHTLHLHNLLLLPNLPFLYEADLAFFLCVISTPPLLLTTPLFT